MSETYLSDMAQHLLRVSIIFAVLFIRALQILGARGEYDLVCVENTPLG